MPLKNGRIERWIRMDDEGKVPDRKVARGQDQHEQDQQHGHVQSIFPQFGRPIACHDLPGIIDESKASNAGKLRLLIGII